MAKPRVHLTKESVSRIVPSSPNEKTFTWDSRLLGFGAYRRSDGVIMFVYQYRRALCKARRITMKRAHDAADRRERDRAPAVLIQEEQRPVCSSLLPDAFDHFAGDVLEL